MSGLRHDRHNIMQAIRGLEPGGVLQLEPGEHRETLVIDRPMILRGAGSSTLLQGIPRSGPVIEVRARGVQIESLVLEHLDQAGVVLRVIPGAEVELKRVRNLAGRVEGACTLEAVAAPAPLPSPPKARSLPVGRASVGSAAGVSSRPSPGPASPPAAPVQTPAPTASPAPSPSLESIRTLESRLEPAPGLLFEGMDSAGGEGNSAQGRKTGRVGSSATRSSGVRATSRGRKASVEAPLESGRTASSGAERGPSVSKGGSSLVEAQGLLARPSPTLSEVGQKAGLSVRPEVGAALDAGTRRGGVAAAGSSRGGVPAGTSPDPGGAAAAGQLVLPGLPPQGAGGTATGNVGQAGSGAMPVHSPNPIAAPTPAAVQAVQGLLAQVAAGQQLAQAPSAGAVAQVLATPGGATGPMPMVAPAPTPLVGSPTVQPVLLQGNGTPGIGRTGGAGSERPAAAPPQRPLGTAPPLGAPLAPTTAGVSGQAALDGNRGTAAMPQVTPAPARPALTELASRAGSPEAAPRTSGERRRPGSTTARRTGPGRIELPDPQALRVESELLVSEGSVEARKPSGLGSTPSPSSDPTLGRATSTPTAQQATAAGSPKGGILRRRPVQVGGVSAAASTVLSVALPPGQGALGTSGPLSAGDSPAAIGAAPLVAELGRSPGRGAGERPAPVVAPAGAPAGGTKSPLAASSAVKLADALKGDEAGRRKVGGGTQASAGSPDPGVAEAGSSRSGGAGTPVAAGAGAAGVGSVAGAMPVAVVTPSVSVQTLPQVIPPSSTLAGAPLSSPGTRRVSPQPSTQGRATPGERLERPEASGGAMSPVPAPAPAQTPAPTAVRGGTAPRAPALSALEVELQQWLRQQGERWQEEAIWIELVRRLAGRPQVPSEEQLRARARQLFEGLHKERREAEERALEREALRERWIRRCWEALIRLPKGSTLETSELASWRAVAGDEAWRAERLQAMIRSGLVAALEPGAVVHLQYAPWGELQVLRRGAVQVWDASDRAPRWFLPVAADKAAVSADGRIFALALGTTLELMDGPTRLRLLDVGDEVLSLAVAPKGECVAAASSGGSLQIWRVSDGEAILHADALAKPLHALTFTPDGTMLVGADAQGRILRWRLPNGDALPMLETGTNLPAALAISPDGVRLVARDVRGFAVFTCEGGHMTRTWRQGVGPGVEELLPASLPLAFLPDGGHVVSLTSSGALGIWQLSRGRLLRELTLPERPSAVAVRAGGTELAVAQGLRGIVCLDAESGQVRRRICTEPAPVLSARFVDGGRILRVRAGDGSTRLYEVTRLRPQTGEEPGRADRSGNMVGESILGQELSIAHAAVRLYLPPPGAEPRKLRLI